MPSLDTGHKGKPWPGYFLVRKESGAIVPLVAVDELPHGLELINAPRHLQLQDAFGMVNLGIVLSSDAHYEIKLSEELRSASIASETVEQARRKTSMEEAYEPTKASEPTVISQNSISPAPRPKVEGKVPCTPKDRLANLTSPITQLCRHWCQHGICKWGQQCRYRHIMPMNLHGLQEAGLTDWPGWYRALNPGYFVSEVPQNLTSHTRIGREARRVKHDRDCCGKGKEEKAIVKGTSAGRFSVREKETGRVVKRGELGDRIAQRLKDMSAEAKPVEKVLDGGGAAEKAVGGGTRRWEEESDEDEEDHNQAKEEGKEPTIQTQGRLVDV